MRSTGITNSSEILIKKSLGVNKFRTVGNKFVNPSADQK